MVMSQHQRMATRWKRRHSGQRVGSMVTAQAWLRVCPRGEDRVTAVMPCHLPGQGGRQAHQLGTDVPCTEDGQGGGATRKNLQKHIDETTTALAAAPSQGESFKAHAILTRREPGAGGIDHLELKGAATESVMDGISRDDHARARLTRSRAGAGDYRGQGMGLAFAL